MHFFSLRRGFPQLPLAEQSLRPFPQPLLAAAAASLLWPASASSALRLRALEGLGARVGGAGVAAHAAEPRRPRAPRRPPPGETRSHMYTHT